MFFQQLKKYGFFHPIREPGADTPTYQGIGLNSWLFMRNEAERDTKGKGGTVGGGIIKKPDSAHVNLFRVDSPQTSII
jgi:hypothetical protein